MLQLACNIRLRQYLQLGQELFFDEHAGKCLSVTEVKASVIQGSGLGPASYVLS